MKYTLKYAAAIRWKAPTEKWVKRWPADLAVPGSVSAGGGNTFHRRRSASVYSLSLSSSHRPDMTEILSKVT